MAFSSADIITLKKALASGTQRVRFEDGREVTYRSVDEINQILRMAEADISSTSTRRHTVAGF